MKRAPTKNGWGVIGVGSLFGLVVSTHALWGDQVIFVRGKPAQGVEVESATYEEVKFKFRGTTRPQTRPAEDVERIIWENERASVGVGRRQLENGNFQEAVAQLNSARTLPDRSGANAGYLLGKAYLLWGSQDPAKYGDAVRAYEDFIKKHGPAKDFYIPYACIGQADAYVAQGKFTEAERRYDDLAKGQYGGQWAAGGKLGQAQVKLAQGSHAAARALFGELIAKSDLRRSFRDQAFLGYARCQLAEKQYQAAIETMQTKLLAPAVDDAASLNRDAAQGWILWGDAEKALAGGDRKKLQWALIRYLRAINVAEVATDDLGEALSKARTVYQELGDRERAEHLKVRLQRECANSKWNQG